MTNMKEDANHFFTAEQQEQIKQAIREAEMQTSGEIRVHLEDECNEDIMDHAAFIFKTLNMHKTDLRNGVLFYLAVKNHRFAILGDAGINLRVEPDFWNKISERMQQKFSQQQFTEGLVEAIKEAGVALKFHFPRSSSDVNELSDELSFGKREDKQK